MSDCLFCKILAKKIPAKFEYEDESVAIIQDINPQAPTHLLVIPKKHVAKVDEATEDDRLMLGEMILRAKEIACAKKLNEGFRLVLNNGAKAGQSVFHIHLHLLGGRVMTWPPG